MAKLLVHVTFLLLCTATTANAHILNMTELHLEFSDSGSPTLNVSIDLGQSLLSAEQYWRAATADSLSDQKRLIDPAVRLLEDGVLVTAQGQPLALQLQSFVLNAVSQESIRNPLTPQMAQLSFSLHMPGRTGLMSGPYEISIAPQLQVPWPALVRADLPGAALPISRLLTASTRHTRPMDESARFSGSQSSVAAELADEFQRWVPGLTWVAVGFQHIIPAGLDHIVFVLGLFFLAPGLKALLAQVSCFTLAHSLTLGLASLGVVTVPAAIIEPLIAATIVYVAFDNLYSRHLARWRLLVITAFGLLHGLGFASALMELSIPAERFLQSLLMFNIGVELGQLAVLALAFVVFGRLRHWAGYSDHVARPAAATIAGIGAYWLVKRVVL